MIHALVLLLGVATGLLLASGDARRRAHALLLGASALVWGLALLHTDRPAWIAVVIGLTAAGALPLGRPRLRAWIHGVAAFSLLGASLVLGVEVSRVDNLVNGWLLQMAAYVVGPILVLGAIVHLEVVRDVLAFDGGEKATRSMAWSPRNPFDGHGIDGPPARGDASVQGSMP